MTIKQYGSLILDLNTVKDFNTRYLYEYPEGIHINNKKNYGNLLERTLILSLYDGNIVTINDEWYSQFIQDYQEFTLNKRNQVAKEAFDYIEKDNSNWVLVKGDFESLYVEIENYLNNQFVFINRKGDFFLYKNKAEDTPLVKGKLESVNLYSTDKAAWIRYAQTIKEAYLDSIVDPVRVANQVLKSRKLDKEWVADNKWLHLRIKNLNNDHTISWGNNLESYSICHKEINKYNFIPPTTNSEWVKAIEVALDKYYELLKQPSEVNLKLMLDKALKDNGLIAKKIFTTQYTKSTKAIVDLEVNKLKWTAYSDNTVEVYLITGDTEKVLASYTLPDSLENWQTIFSDSLAQYKQLDKLRQPKLTEVALINCLENTIKLSVNGVFSTNSSLIGSLRVTWNDVIIEWILKEESVEVYWVNKCPLFEGAYSKPTTLNEWEKLFKETFNKVTTTIQKIEIHNILFHGACYKKEPTLIDLIKKAFPSYNLHKSYTSESGNFIYYGCHKSLSLEVAYNPKLNVIELFTVKERKEGGEYYFSKGRDFFTKENLTNYTNWEQWLEDLIKLNQNLKELEQSPRSVQNAQRTKNLNVSTPTTQQEIEDFWAD